MFLRAFALLFALSLGACADPSTVLILQFHNASQYPDLSWVGESVSETLTDSLSAENQIVFHREARNNALDQLGLRPGADFTKASLIRLGQSLGANYVCYGSFQAILPPGETDLKHGSIQLEAHLLDLRKLHDGPDLAEAGKLADLSRIEQHLAWQLLRYLAPELNLPVDQFLAPNRLTRVDAEESYIRGLLSASPEKRQKWFLQALALDRQFASPLYQLGKLSLDAKQYRQAITWLQRIPPADPRYPEARYKMGIAAYRAADYVSSANYFREIATAFPLNEIYNNLAAAEAQLNQPNAIADFRRALDGDPNDPVYLFNLGDALLQNSQFDEAATRLQAVLVRTPNDAEASNLLARARRRDFIPAGAKLPAPPRLKPDFDPVAFQQLRALVQRKTS